MSEENTEAIEQTPQVEEDQAEEVSLDDLYSDFPVQEMQTPQSTQQEQVTPSYEAKVDPISDPDGLNSYLSGLKKDFAGLQSELQATKAELSQEKQRLAAEAEERDLRTVASEIAKKAGVEDDLVEAMMLRQFMTDKGFQRAWQGRGQNPKAFGKIKSTLANQYKGRFSAKHDAQLEENQRAVEEANKSASSRKKEDPSKEDQFSGLSNKDFDAKFRSLVNSGF